MSISIRQFIVFVSLAVAAVLWVNRADAEPGAQPLQCGRLDEALTHFQRQWGEAPMLLTRGGRRLLFLGNPDGSTWTLLMIVGPGHACLIASGTEWSFPNPKPEGEPT